MSEKRSFTASLILTAWFAAALGVCVWQVEAVFTAEKADKILKLFTIC